MRSLCERLCGKGPKLVGTRPLPLRHYNANSLPYPSLIFSSTYIVHLGLRIQN